MQIDTRGGGTNRLAPPIEVLGCEVVQTGRGHDLLRVILAAQRGAAVRLSDITLVAEDSSGRHRFSALPALPTAAHSHGSMLTVGFAMPASLLGAALVLESGGQETALPSPAVRALAGPAPDDNHGAVLAAELRALDFATAAVRAESDRLELEAALIRSKGALNEAEAELARLRTAAPPQEPPASRSRAWWARRAAGLGATAVLCAAIAWGVNQAGTDEPARGGAAVKTLSPETVAAGRATLARRLGIPPLYLALYRSAGRRYDLDWTMLAAVGDVETANGKASLPGVLTGENHLGASGPAQFLRATWEDYGLDGDGDGARNPYDPADAIPAMASYLRASGAPRDWTGALMAYNHSAAYAAEVQRRAARYRTLLHR